MPWCNKHKSSPTPLPFHPISDTHTHTHTCMHACTEKLNSLKNYHKLHKEAIFLEKEMTNKPIRRLNSHEFKINGKLQKKYVLEWFKKYEEKNKTL